MVASSKSVGKSIAANSGAPVAPQTPLPAQEDGASVCAFTVAREYGVRACLRAGIAPDPSKMNDELSDFEAADRVFDLQALIQAAHSHLDSFAEGPDDPHGAWYTVARCVRVVIKALDAMSVEVARNSAGLDEMAEACFDASSSLQAAHGLLTRWVEDGLLERETADPAGRMLRGCWRAAYQLGIDCSESAGKSGSVAALEGKAC